jgi:hypothetical protein
MADDEILCIVEAGPTSYESGRVGEDDALCLGSPSIYRTG